MDGPMPGSAWIFQSTPATYDLGRAVQELSEISWFVGQHRQSIHVGDVAYLWETGEAAGILAVGRVLTEPEILAESEEELKYWHQPEKVEPAPRVRLAIERVLWPRLLRSNIKSDPILIELANLKFAQGTNFPVTDEQAERLESFIARLDDLNGGPAARGGRLRREFFEVAFFLSHCGERRDGRTPNPPTELSAASWEEAYDAFYASLGDGRPVQTFRNSLKGARDAFDSHLEDSGRVGWRVGGDATPGLPAPLSALPLEVFDAWRDSLCDEIWSRVKHLVGPMPIAAARFDEQWQLLLDLVARQPFWDSLGRKYRYQVDSVEADRISFRNRDGNINVATKSRVGRLWAEAVANPIEGAGFDTRALTSLVAQLPSIEYTERHLYYVDPPTHLLGEPREHRPEASGASVPAPKPRPTIEALADELCLEAEYLRSVEWLLKDRQQIVFYGPPGTGKTYVAEALAAWFTGTSEHVETIQFHPSYAYEDFIEGIRPVLDDQQLRYALDDGLLKRFAERAQNDPDPESRYVLVIDEINRANLARVFGELLYLLEYRSKSVILPYSREPFALPSNLYFIGTMNTADRSIALVDFALRRRFHFVEFAADPAILRRWLIRHDPSMTEVADLLSWVNRQIGDRDFAIGFSYFMRADLDEQTLRRVWDHSIIPALHEFYFDDARRPDFFSLDNARKALRGSTDGVQEVDPGLELEPSDDEPSVEDLVLE